MSQKDSIHKGKIPKICLEILNKVISYCFQWALFCVFFLLLQLRISCHYHILCVTVGFYNLLGKEEGKTFHSSLHIFCMCINVLYMKWLTTAAFGPSFIMQTTCPALTNVCPPEAESELPGFVQTALKGHIWHLKWPQMNHFPPLACLPHLVFASEMLAECRQLVPVTDGALIHKLDTDL